MSWHHQAPSFGDVAMWRFGRCCVCTLSVTAECVYAVRTVVGGVAEQQGSHRPCQLQGVELSAVPYFLYYLSTCCKGMDSATASSRGLQPCVKRLAR